jgi:hypothetical protein
MERTALFPYLVEWFDARIKKNKKFLIYKKILMGSGAKSCMYEEELPKNEEMQKYFHQNEEVVSHIGLCSRSL